MQETSVFVAADGSVFIDSKRCHAYEELHKALKKIDRNSLSTLSSGQPASILDWINEAGSGENKLDRMLGLYYIAFRLFGETDDVKELLSDAFSYELSSWKSKYSGIARELVSIPGNSSKEDVWRVLRKYDSNRIACALETIENSEIPLRVYRLIKEYLP